MNNMHETDLDQHITILGWLYVVGNGVALVIGTCVLMLLTGVGLAVDDPQARAVLLTVGPVVGLLLGALSLPGLAAGYGLITRKPWARVLAIVVGVLGLLNVPIGTCVGLYALWVLAPTRAQDYFASSGISAA